MGESSALPACLHPTAQACAAGTRRGREHAYDSSPITYGARSVGMVLAGTVGKDHALTRRLRTLTFGLLTPFYFIRAGSFVSVAARSSPR